MFFFFLLLFCRGHARPCFSTIHSPCFTHKLATPRTHAHGSARANTRAKAVSSTKPASPHQLNCCWLSFRTQAKDALLLDSGVAALYAVYMGNERFLGPTRICAGICVA